MSDHVPPYHPLPPSVQTSSPEVHRVAVIPDLAPGELGNRVGRDPDAIDWRRYMAAALHRRWWIVAGTALGLAAGVAGARLLPPQYRVQATVWVDGPDRQDPNRGPIRQGQLLQAYAWVDLLRSFAVLDSVVRQQRLYVSAGGAADTLALASFDVADHFRPGSYRLAIAPDGRSYTLSSNGEVLDSGAVGDSVGRPVGFRWAPPPGTLPKGHTLAFGLVTPREAAQGLSERLTVHLDPNGNFMALELTGTNPRRTAQVLNAVTERYVDVAAELKRAKLTELTHILSDQLATAGANLQSVESGLANFQVRTITLPSQQTAPAPSLEGTGDPLLKNFFEMRIEREQLHQDRQAIERVLNSVTDSGAVQSLEGVGAVQRSSALVEALHELTTKQAELRVLRYHYTDAYPGERRAAGELETLEHQTIPALTRVLLTQVEAREEVLDSLLGSAGKELRAIPQRAVDEARLQRDVTIAENLYTTLQQRYEEARLAEASTIPDVRVLDAAVAPRWPTKNSGPRFMLMGLVGGVAMSLVGVFLADRLDGRIRYPDQVTHEMGLHILGAVPRLPSRLASARPEQITQVIEALRTVRLSVAHACEQGSIIVTVTSPGPGDGKSFVASNLARTFADAGQTTLLIDGDGRRGRLHRVFQTTRKPGLIDVLAGNAVLEDVVHVTDHPMLRLMASGTRQSDAPELLGSAQMARIISWARANYHAVIVDSPPLGAGIDAFVLGAHTGRMLVVLRTGTTDRTLAQVKLEGLDRLGIRVIGAVLNDVEPKGVYRYYGYLSGYAVAESAEKHFKRLAGTG